jgi:hypothetical protein
MTLRTIPLTLAQANDYVAKLHRHHDRCTAHRFSFGAVKDGWLVGVVIVGRPVSFHYDAYNVAEVSRLCSVGTRNTCSFLYGAAARIARDMGFYRIQTYTLEEETGESLRAYGNAISPWPAAEFIAAYREARGENAVTLLDMIC